MGLVNGSDEYWKIFTIKNVIVQVLKEKCGLKGEKTLQTS